MDSEREDIKILDELDELLDLSLLSFEQSQAIFTGFICDELLCETTQRALNLDSNFFNQAKQLMATAIDFTNGKTSLACLQRSRYKAWQIHDSYTIETIERHYMRVLVYVLYDKQAAEFDTFGAEQAVEVFVSCLFDLDASYCARFKDYFVKCNHLST